MHKMMGGEGLSGPKNTPVSISLNLPKVPGCVCLILGAFACTSTPTVGIARPRNINTCARAHKRITHPRPVDGGV